MKIDHFATIQNTQCIQRLVAPQDREMGKAMLWQKDDQGKRFWQQVRHITFDGPKQNLCFYPAKGKFNFLPLNEIYYVRLKKLTLFKTPLLFNSFYKLVAQMPSSVMIKEERVNPRDIPEGKKRLIQFTYNPFHRKIVDDIYLCAEVIDTSNYGISFKHSIFNIIQFKIGDQIEFRTPQVIPWGTTKKGEIRHVSKIRSIESGEYYYKVGVQLIK